MWVVILNHQPSTEDNFLWVFEAEYSIFHVLSIIPDHLCKDFLTSTSKIKGKLSHGCWFLCHKWMYRKVANLSLYLGQSSLLIWPPTVIQNLHQRSFFKKQEAEHLGAWKIVLIIYFYGMERTERKKKKRYLMSLRSLSWMRNFRVQNNSFSQFILKIKKQCEHKSQCSKYSEVNSIHAQIPLSIPMCVRLSQREIVLSLWQEKCTCVSSVLTISVIM